MKRNVYDRFPPWERSMSTKIEGYAWKTYSGEWRIRAPWRSKHGMIWATVELIEPTTVVEENADG